MAAELFSTSLPHSNEVEVKKSFIQPTEPEPPAGNHGDDNRDDNRDEVQPTVNKEDREERDGRQETQPTLRERSAQYSALIGQQRHNLFSIIYLLITINHHCLIVGNISAD